MCVVSSVCVLCFDLCVSSLDLSVCVLSHVFVRVVFRSLCVLSVVSRGVMCLDVSCVVVSRVCHLSVCPLSCVSYLVCVVSHVWSYLTWLTCACVCRISRLCVDSHVCVVSHVCLCRVSLEAREPKGLKSVLEN